MVVQVDQQLAVLHQPLVEPGAVLAVDRDDLIADGGLPLAHRSIVSMWASGTRPLVRRSALEDRRSDSTGRPCPHPVGHPTADWEASAEQDYCGGDAMVIPRQIGEI